MAARRGYTLMEILVVVVIVGIAAAVTIPNFIASAEQTKAQMAKNNLLAIAAAQEKYNEDHGSYYTAGNPYNSLNLSPVASDPFAYSCTATASLIPYKCTAADAVDSLTLDPNAQPPVSCIPGGCGLS